MKEQPSFETYYKVFSFVSGFFLLGGGILMQMFVFGNWTFYIIGNVIFLIGFFWWFDTLGSENKIREAVEIAVKKEVNQNLKDGHVHFSKEEWEDFKIKGGNYPWARVDVLLNLDDTDLEENTPTDFPWGDLRSAEEAAEYWSKDFRVKNKMIIEFQDEIKVLKMELDELRHNDEDEEEKD